MLPIVAALIAFSQAPSLSSFQQRVRVGSGTVAAQVVKVRLSSVRMKIGLAQGLVGRTAELANIATREHAVAAINGSFFEAYEKTELKNPNHTLISDGRVLHIGNVGTLVAFDAFGSARIERRQFTILGSRNGSSKWPNSWFAYWLNRVPKGSAVTIYTSDFGSRTFATDGTSITVDNGVVSSISSGGVPIPRNGFVIYFRSAEPKLLQTFRVGQRCAFEIVSKGGSDPFWKNVTEAVGAGPLLVRNGAISLEPAAEGFSDPKILSLGGLRSAVGITSDGYLLLVAASGTVRDMATVMLALGAHDAMNLDGGASSGLWLNGKYLRKPGREISNALLVLLK